MATYVEPVLQTEEIQGHSLRGFGTDYIWVVCFKFAPGDAPKSWLRGLADQITTLGGVLRFRDDLKHNVPDAATQVLLNAAFSCAALTRMGTDGTFLGDKFFNKPMGDSAADLGDDTQDYVIGKDADHTPDVVLLIGSMSSDAADQRKDELVTQAGAAGLTVLLKDKGGRLPGEKEHFGYRDSISLPVPRGLLDGNPPTPLVPRLIAPPGGASPRYAAPGQPLVWPGQFVFGLPQQDTSDLARPGLNAASGAKWAKNGSFLVFRRLKQDVDAFESFATSAAAALSTQLNTNFSAEEMAASIIGRWPDGTPQAMSPRGPNLAISGNDAQLNDFNYTADPSGFQCPCFSHVRKVNPRDTPVGMSGPAATLAKQILRRGIPLGPLHSEAPAEDRGLLFLAYQTSFEKQFWMLQRMWLNSPDGPEKKNQGYDLLAGQASGERFGMWNAPGLAAPIKIPTLAKWVTCTGGAFLFSPSVSFLKGLA